VREGAGFRPDSDRQGEVRGLSPGHPKPHLLRVCRGHDLLRQASVELVRTLLPTAKGIRLLGVTVSNFEDPPTDVADELPLFADKVASARRPDTTPVVEATGEL
jgi:hypothetical protein